MRHGAVIGCFRPLTAVEATMSNASAAPFELTPEMAAVYGVAGGVSALFCVLVLLMFYEFPDCRRHPSALLGARVACDLVLAVGRMVSAPPVFYAYGLRGAMRAIRAGEESRY